MLAVADLLLELEVILCRMRARETSVDTERSDCRGCSDCYKALPVELWAAERLVVFPVLGSSSHEKARQKLSEAISGGLLADPLGCGTARSICDIYSELGLPVRPSIAFPKSNDALLRMSMPSSQIECNPS